MSIKKFLIIFLFTVFAAAVAVAAPADPFPRSVKYPFGIRPSVSAEVLARIVQDAYEDWLMLYLTRDGCPENAFRIHRYLANDFDTVSEGIGYGMLIMALMDNEKNQTQRYFDGLWKYYRSYLNEFGLMYWKIDRQGNVISEDSAADGDEDAAMALLYAHKQWGSSGQINYLEEANALILKIMSCEVTKEDFVLKPGSEWGGYNITNPSYYDPAYYRAWQSFDKSWSEVLARCQKIYRYFHSKYETGLMPDWCVADGSTAYLSYNYSYDACRVPLKIGLDYLWNGQGGEQLDKISGWITRTTNGNPELIVDGYKLNGIPLGKYNNAAFVGPFCVAAMVSKQHQEWLNKSVSCLIGLETGGRFGYYNDTLRLLSLLIISGNMPNLWEIKIKEEPEQWQKG
jgi:endo-1,4-beta-D-glucanase Y